MSRAWLYTSWWREKSRGSTSPENNRPRSIRAGESGGSKEKRSFTIPRTEIRSGRAGRSGPRTCPYRQRLRALPGPAGDSGRSLSPRRGTRADYDLLLPHYMELALAPKHPVLLALGVEIRLFLLATAGRLAAPLGDRSRRLQSGGSGSSRSRGSSAEAGCPCGPRRGTTTRPRS